MKKSIFNTLIKNPKKKIDNTSKDEVNQLKNKFPYCELIHNLSLIQASLDDDINFNEVLSLSSLYSINREKLFTTINPKILSSKSQTSLNKYHFEEKSVIDSTWAEF